MKISEFIKLLEAAKKLHGDVEVWITHEWSSPIYSEINFYDESFEDVFHEYWPARIDISLGSYDHRTEYKQRKEK